MRLIFTPLSFTPLTFAVNESESPSVKLFMNKTTISTNPTTLFISKAIASAKRVAGLGALACFAALVSGCATLTEHTFTITPGQMQQKLAEKLNKPIKLLKVFDVNLSNPLVQLDPATDRISTAMDASVSNALLGKAFKGRANVSGKLRFDAPTQTVVLIEPKLESFNVDGLSANNSNLVSAFSTMLLGEFMNELPLYTLKPDDLKVAGIQFNPKQIKVGPQGLLVTLSPK